MSPARMAAAYGVQSLMDEMAEEIAAADGDTETAIGEVVARNSGMGIPAQAWLTLLVEAVAQLAELKAKSR